MSDKKFYSKIFTATGTYPYYGNNIKILNTQKMSAKRELLRKIAKQLEEDDDLKIEFNEDVEIEEFKKNSFSLKLRIEVTSE